MGANFWIKGWMAWVVKIALLALLSAAALRAQPFPASADPAPAAPASAPVPTKADYLAATRHLGLTLDNRMRTSGNLVAWATGDSIRFGEIRFMCTLDLCGSCSPELRALPGIALPGPKHATPPPFGLAPLRLRTDRVNRYDIEIAYMMPEGAFYHHVARLPSLDSPQWSITTETRAAALQAGESPRMVAIGGNPWDIFSSSIFVGGTGRLLLTTGWNDQTGLMDLRKDPFTTLSPLSEDLISSGGGLFGGSAGGVTGWQYDVQPTHASTGMPTAVRALDAYGAMGDDGWIATQEHSTWKAYQLAPGTYRDFRIVADARGLGVLRYPPAGEPVYSRLRESPTRFASIETMGGPIDRNPPDLKRMTLHPGPNAGIKAVVADSEGNFSALRVDLVDAAGDTLRLGKDFTGSDVPGACAGPGICVQPDKPFLEIRSDADSVYVSMTVQAAFVDGTCFRLINRSDSAWTAAAPWKRGSRLSIRAGRGQLEADFETTGIGRWQSGRRLSGSGTGAGALAGRTEGPTDIRIDVQGRRIPPLLGVGSAGAVIRKFPLPK